MAHNLGLTILGIKEGNLHQGHTAFGPREPVSVCFLALPRLHLIKLRWGAEDKREGLQETRSVPESQVKKMCDDGIRQTSSNSSVYTYIKDVHCTIMVPLSEVTKGLPTVKSCYLLGRGDGLPISSFSIVSCYIVIYFKIQSFLPPVILLFFLFVAFSPWPPHP